MKIIVDLKHININNLFAMERKYNEKAVLIDGECIG